MAGKFRKWFKKNRGKILGTTAAIATGGISVGVGHALDKKRKKDKTRKSLEEQLRDVAKNSPKLNLQTTGEYTDMQRRAAEIPGQVKYRDLPKYTSAKEAAGYVTDMQKSLGVKSPQDLRNAKRAAVYDQLDRGAYEAASEEASRLASQNMSGTGAALALAGRRQNELAGQKLATEAQLQEDYANSMDAYRKEMMGYGLNQAGELSQYDENAAQQANEFALRKAGAESDALARAGNALSDDDFRRTNQLYEANQLMPWQAEMGAMAGELARMNERRGQNMAFAGGVINTAAGVGGAMLGAPGMISGGGQPQMPQTAQMPSMPAYTPSALKTNFGAVPKYQSRLGFGAGYGK